MLGGECNGELGEPGKYTRQDNTLYLQKSNFNRELKKNSSKFFKYIQI